MRLVALAFVPALVVGVLVVGPAEPAHAHGGQFGHASRGPVPFRAPSMACDCGRVECPACSAPGLRDGAALSRCETQVEVLESWGDLARVRVTTEFATEVERPFLEAAARVGQGPLFAVTAGRVTCPERRQELTGELAPSREARRDYLWERDTRLRDPMLVLRDGPGAVWVRVFPVSPVAATTATLEGFALQPPPPGLVGSRLYRTGDRFVAVLPRAGAVLEPGDVVDEAGARVLRFLSAGAARVRYPSGVSGALEVPCVTALHEAATGRGESAVTDGTALVALPPGSKAPPTLFVGPAEDAPTIDPRRAVEDPEPPPPPPLAP